MERRALLKIGLLAAAVVPLAPLPVYAGLKGLLHDERRLTFYNLHTDEKLRVCYCRNGRYDSEALKDIKNILRDHRTGEVHHIDRQLLDLLHGISIKLKTECFHVISGYRSPSTNAMLSKRSSGVASKSLHMYGKAIDIRMPGVNTRRVYKTAVNLKAGGVGFYPASDFVHVDVGRVRYW